MHASKYKQTVYNSDILLIIYTIIKSSLNYLPGCTKISR